MEAVYRCASARSMDYVNMQRGETMTNAEMIRNMSDEELAVTIMCPNETGHAEINCDHSDNCDCCQCCLDWLRREVD